jgi:hypothetical protein
LPRCLEPHLEILPAPQRSLWPRLGPIAKLSYVLYGGTATALYFAHRESVDFDFFRAEPLNKAQIADALPFLSGAATLQDEVDTLVVSVALAHGAVKLSFFGGIGIGRVNDPLQTADRVLLVASPDDLMATKLKAILDRAEARDYRDIAELLRHGVSLAKGLAAFRAMFRGEPITVLRALCSFEDGNLKTLDDADRKLLTTAAAEVRELPSVSLTTGTLAIPIGSCDDIVRF